MSGAGSYFDGSLEGEEKEEEEGEFYTLLNVGRDAEPEQIRSAYRR